jgi:hypothetical protein
MTSSEPPALAKWILVNVHFKTSSDALIGDLVLGIDRAILYKPVQFQRAVAFRAIVLSVGSFRRSCRSVSSRSSKPQA